LAAGVATVRKFLQYSADPLIENDLLPLFRTEMSVRGILSVRDRPGSSANRYDRQLSGKHIYRLAAVRQLYFFRAV
jgi:hypothetical protein